MAKVIRHINADMLSDDELEMFSDKFKDAEKKMDEKIYDEICDRQFKPQVTDSGIWLPHKPC